MGALACLLPLTVTVVALASCGPGTSATLAPAHTTGPAASPSPAGRHQATVRRAARRASRPLPAPAALAPFGSPAAREVPGARPADGPRRARRLPTTLVPPGGTQPAGIAWMDTRLLAARLYSGSRAPRACSVTPRRSSRPGRHAGGRVQRRFHHARAAAATTRKAARSTRCGGGRLAGHLRDGSADVGAWGRDVRMTRTWRRPAEPRPARGRPPFDAAGGELGLAGVGSTCGALLARPRSPASSTSGVPARRTADGALVYAAGPPWTRCSCAASGPRRRRARHAARHQSRLARLRRYAPPSGALAGAAQRPQAALLAVQGPSTFFESWWARDFITMSARPTGYFAAACARPR